MNILDQIVATKRQELAIAKARVPVAVLERAVHFVRVPYSLVDFVRRKDKTGIIAEFKRRSPSKGILNANATIANTTTGYVAAGASALSILTDTQYFGGRNDDLMQARDINECPILRKDFTVDEYQVVEAKSIGADAILLIAAILTPKDAHNLCTLAHSFGLEVLLEVHDEVEVEKFSSLPVDLIGVNNRNLKTFEVSIETSKRLASAIPKNVAKISESGISDPSAIHDLREHGYDGFLVGESFMKSQHPGKAAKDFMSKLRHKEVQ